MFPNRRQSKKVSVAVSVVVLLSVFIDGFLFFFSSVSWLYIIHFKIALAQVSSIFELLFAAQSFTFGAEESMKSLTTTQPHAEDAVNTKSQCCHYLKQNRSLKFAFINQCLQPAPSEEDRSKCVGIWGVRIY